MPIETKLEHVRVDQIDEPVEPSRADIDEAGIHELAASISAQGLLQPIGIKPYDQGDRYRLSYGHRRLLAVRFLGWFTIPAIILPPGTSEIEAQQHENSQRVQLTPVEEARQLARFQAAGDSVQAIAARMQKSSTWVAARLRLLRYPDDLLTAIHVHGLPLTVADQLAQIPNDNYRRHLTDDALRHGASAHTVAVWLQHYLADQPRIDSNADMIEEVIARRDQYQILAPCEYCGTATPLQETRMWRLCAGCSNGLAGAVNQAKAGGP